jgi:metallophosphoesterase (TIGR03767 family)
VPASGGADPAGKSTLEETIRIRAGSGFQLLETAPGDPFVTRKSSLGRALSGRDKRRRSMLFFGQLTDPQVVDEMAIRFDFLDEVDEPVQDGWRPQDTLSAQLFDQMIRNMNANRTSAVRPGKGKSARMQFAINTGDMADNSQLNETRMVVDILDGKTVDPFSGKPVGPGNPCDGQNEETIARLNADAMARRYTGVQDYDDYTAPDARKSAYWDPDIAPPGASPFTDWPRYPGLLDRAQQPFQADGLDVPWYTARGNHDDLILGFLRTNFALARGLVASCQKIFPSDKLDPTTLRGLSDDEILVELTEKRLNDILAGLRPVPPDPDRRYVDEREYKQLHDTGDNSHGYGYVDKTELKRSANAAAYYAFSPRSGFRFVSLDSVADAGASDGNIDDPQYEWLKRELDRNSSTEWNGSRLVRDGDKDRLTVVYSHHKLEDLTITANDEAAGECVADYDPGCDRDPRKSTPIHRGLKGKETIRDLLLRYPNVIAFVTGHSHKNEVKAFNKSGRSGFWQINTASHNDFPQQARQIEVMDNRDGTLSIFNTVLDQAAPVEPPPFGTPANVFEKEQLASIGRLVAANDPQGLGPRGTGDRLNAGRGKAADRNVELPLRDPRRLGRR